MVLVKLTDGEDEKGTSAWGYAETRVLAELLSTMGPDVEIVCRGRTEACSVCFPAKRGRFIGVPDGKNGMTWEIHLVTSSPGVVTVNGTDTASGESSVTLLLEADTEIHIKWWDFTGTYTCRNILTLAEKVSGYVRCAEIRKNCASEPLEMVCGEGKIGLGDLKQFKYNDIIR